MLEPLFGSSTKEKVLLFLHTHGDSYASEIARAFGLHLNAVQAQLGNLEAGGVLYSRLRGRVRLFGINPRYPFRKELAALLERALTFLPEKDLAAWYRPRLRPRRAGKPL